MHGRALPITSTALTLLVAVAACEDALTPTAPAPNVAAASSAMSCLDDGMLPLPSGAPYQICVNPRRWNGDLVVFVPGYTNPAAPPSTPSGDLGGLSAAEIVTGIGYAWATTGFRETGLFAPDRWIAEDLLSVVQAAKTFLQNRVGRIYLTGGSQGGLIATLGVERYPRVFTGGGLAACGPIGSYRRQLEYVGDFRAVFDVYFDPVITTPDWPVWTQRPPSNGMVDPAYWTGTSRGAVVNAIRAHPGRTTNLLNVTRAPIDPSDPEATTRQTVLGLLRYSFVGTNDAVAKLGGLPFANAGRRYSGSRDDAALNRGVQRFTSTASELSLQALETTGGLARPLVTIHTTGDPIVPIWHQSVYRNKTGRRFDSRLLHSRITITRYGHCSLTPEEALGAFALLVLKTTGHDLVLSAHVLPEPRSQAEFLRAARAFGAAPTIALR